MIFTILIGSIKIKIRASTALIAVLKAKQYVGNYPTKIIGMEET